MNNINNGFEPKKIQEATELTQKNFKNLQEKNEMLAKEFQQVLVSAPTDMMNFFKSQHEKNLELNNQLMAAFTKTPIDYTAITSLITDNTQNNFNVQLDTLKKNTEKYQNVFSKYFS